MLNNNVIEINKIQPLRNPEDWPDFKFHVEVFALKVNALEILEGTELLPNPITSLLNPLDKEVLILVTSLCQMLALNIPLY
jgi:hypothetical protein